MTKPASAEHADNQVFLRGKLAREPVIRVLPSGDELCSFRVTVDSVECATTKPRVRKTLGRAAPGDQIEVTGSLHRRFWRSPAGPASRYEVDVHSARLSARRQTDA